MPLVIGLSGQMGSGKSTAATYLIEAFGFKRIRFAGPLKAMFRSYLETIGLDAATIERMVEGDLKQIPSPSLCDQTPRYFMQKLGTEFGRDMIGCDFWINAWKTQARRALDANVPVVVDDCRFENEAVALRSMGGRVVEIRRDPALPPPAEAHVSEAGVWSDYVIINRTDDFDHLQRKLRTLMNVAQNWDVAPLLCAS